MVSRDKVMGCNATWLAILQTLQGLLPIQLGCLRASDLSSALLLRDLLKLGQGFSPGMSLEHGGETLKGPAGNT